MTEKKFTRREAIWIGTLGLVQLGILTSASTGLWDFGGKSNLPQIQFKNKVDLPQSNQVQANQKTIKIAIASVISPMENVNLYSELLNVLGNRINMQVQMLQRQNYSDTNRLIESGEVDVAFICSGALLDKDKHEQAERIIVTPEIAGSATYRSYIIVRSSSKAQSLYDLKNKSFAYMDPLSFSGRIAPQYMVKKIGYRAQDFFKKSIFTYSHDNSIKAVSEGIVDGAAVDSLIYDLTVSRQPDLLSKIKVIDQSEEVGNPPVVVSEQINPELRALIKNVLLTMHLDAEGRKALKVLQFDRFIHPDLKLYDRVWEMAREVREFE